MVFLHMCILWKAAGVSFVCKAPFSLSPKRANIDRTSQVLFQTSFVLAVQFVYLATGGINVSMWEFPKIGDPNIVPYYQDPKTG